jgi:mannosyl-oligosaccharide alpha-1,2-mannosidase
MAQRQIGWNSLLQVVDIAEHSLTCFAPGNFLLGGRALNREDIFTYGLDILEGCWRAYNATPAGIAPEGLKYVGRASDSSVAMEKQ